MTPVAIAGLGGLTALLSALMTWQVIQYCVKSNRLDVPNDRSLHTAAVPRGGGLAVVTCSVLAFGFLAAAGHIAIQQAAALIGGTAAIAGVGWIDDKKGLSAGLRLIVHLLASTLAVLFSGLDATSNPLLAVALIIALAWCVNLYNFMDGMDGFASGQAVFLGIGGTLILYAAGFTGLAAAMAALAGAAAGFFYWNRPKAKIFLGDVGSGAIGYMIGALTLFSGVAAPHTTIPLLILFAVFAVDATFTLTRRLLRKVNVTKPHRSHAYQKAYLLGRSHAQILAAVVALQLLWLAPLAAFAYLNPSTAWIALAAAATPILALDILLKAGTEELPTLPQVSENTT